MQTISLHITNSHGRGSLLGLVSLQFYPLSCSFFLENSPVCPRATKRKGKITSSLKGGEGISCQVAPKTETKISLAERKKKVCSAELCPEFSSFFYQTV